VLFHAQPSEQLLAAKLPIGASIRLVTFQTLVKFDHQDGNRLTLLSFMYACCSRDGL
jgi:hypothetical protein